MIDVGCACPRKGPWSMVQRRGQTVELQWASERCEDKIMNVTSSVQKLVHDITMPRHVGSKLIRILTI